jgi:hypothetical protein
MEPLAMSREAMYGNCPVQGERLIDLDDGSVAYAYFRARGAAWSVDVWKSPTIAGYPVVSASLVGALTLPDGDPSWCVWAPWGQWPHAGWMDYAVADGIFDLMIDAYLAGWPGEGTR